MTHLLALMDEGNLNLATPVKDTPFGPIAQVTLGKWIPFAISAILIFGTIAAFIFLLLGAVQWITAGGDKEGTEKAKKRITGAIIGLVILLLAYAILIFVGSLFFGNGKTLLDLTLPTL